MAQLQIERERLGHTYRMEEIQAEAEELLAQGVQMAERAVDRLIRPFAGTSLAVWLFRNWLNGLKEDLGEMKQDLAVLSKNEHEYATKRLPAVEGKVARLEGRLNGIYK